MCNAVHRLKVFAKVEKPHPLAVLCVCIHSFVCVSQPLLGHNLGPLALSSQLPNTTNVHTVASGPKGLQVGIRIGFSLRTNKRQINHSWISSWQFSATCTIHGTPKQSGNDIFYLKMGAHDIMSWVVCIFFTPFLKSIFLYLWWFFPKNYALM